jgi:hypothetical protein
MRMSATDAQQLQYSDSDPIVTVFRGAVIGRQIAHPNRSFALEVTLDLAKGKEFFSRKPPTHFHFQEEYIQTLEGKLGLEVEGEELILTAADGPYTIRPFVNHRSYPLPESLQEGCQVVKFILSGKKTSETYELSPVFFENWYKYQDDIVVNGAQLSLIQLLSVGCRNFFSPMYLFIDSDCLRYSPLVDRIYHFHVGFHLVRPCRRPWELSWEDG